MTSNDIEGRSFQLFETVLNPKSWLENTQHLPDTTWLSTDSLSVSCETETVIRSKLTEYLGTGTRQIHS